MTIKKRLFLSNLLMILVPVGITLLIALGSIGVIWYAVTNGTGLSFDDSEDFYHAGQGISAAVEKALKAAPEERLEKLTLLSSLLDHEAMTLTVEANGTNYYQYGNANAADAALLKASALLGNEGTLSSGNRSLYAHQIKVGNDHYQIFLLCSSSKFSNVTLKMLIVLVALILVFTIFLSILLTNRFLTKFVFQKIERPLDILADGVHQIRDGNLDFRIQYDNQDEFALVCADFNEMAARLKVSVEQTRRHEESQKELLAGISHDLRSPLTSVQAYVEGLLDGVAKTPEARKKYLLTIKAKAEDIERMVSQIFLFSKMELDEYPLHMKMLHLDSLIEDFVKNFGAEYATRGLSLAVKPALEPAAVNADPEQLHRVLMNIADNSLKYKNKEMGHLAIVLQNTENFAIVTLTDDGPGVAEEDLPKLFDTFYRTDPARRDPEKGSGLGLAIVAKAVQQMGGSVEARNAAGGGLTIAVSLPKEIGTDE